MSKDNNQFQLFDVIANANDIEKKMHSNFSHFCFWGRSNVGKSSLINHILKQKNLCRTSNTPGRTQQINLFYNTKIIIADLPGYGFAKTPINVRDKWNIMIGEYLRSQSNIQCLFLLIDARLGIKTNDFDVINLLNEWQIPFQIVITKTDKAKNINDVQNQIINIIKDFDSCEKEIIQTSIKQRYGANQILKKLQNNYI